MIKAHPNSHIVELLRVNREEGFRAMFLTYYASLKRVAIRMVGADFAEDVVQEVFTRFWQNAPEFNHIDALKAYLYTGTHRQCLNILRKNGLLELYKESLQNEEWEEFVLDEEIIVRLYQAIDLLPEHYRQVMVKSLQGEPIASIAQLMHTTEDAIKAYKRRSKQLLKEVFKEIYLEYR